MPLATLPLGSSTAAGPDSIASALQFIHPWTGPTFNFVRVRTSNFAFSVRASRIGVELPGR